MRRREFIAGVGATTAMPLAGHAQQAGRMRRIGILVAGADTPETQPRRAALLEELQKRGWHDGRNLKIDYRSGAGNVSTIRRHAAELVALAPEVIVTTGTPALAQMLQATRTVPIVFVNVGDPVGAGYV